MEKSTRLGQKLGVVHSQNNDIPEKSGYGLSNSASEGMVLQSAGFEAVSSITHPSLSSMSPSKIQHLVNEHVHSIVDPWIGSLPFNVFKWDKSKGDVSKIFVKNP